MKQKLVVVFNTCGISGREHVDLYKQCIHAILNQEMADFRVVVSSCLNSRNARVALLQEFGNRISYNIIDTLVPVNISFNHTVMKAVEVLGAADGYLYVDSGIFFADDKLVLKKLHDLHTSGPYGMTAGRTNTDSGVFLWYGKGSSPEDESGQEELFANGNFIVPVGKTLNLHIQVFDHQLYETFNHRIMPDIFASHSTEGIFTYLNAVIQKKFIWHKDVKVVHHTGVDGGSSGFRPEYAGVPGWQHTLGCAPRKIVDLIADPEAKEVGFGYEECQNILMHDPAKFDENGYSKDPERLKKFLMNFYLPDDRFHYDLIDYQFIP